jgi:hypothetical protein
VIRHVFHQPNSYSLRRLWFRSRTEARYACLWRTLDWPYEFEIQKFTLECGAFIPDFWLRGRGWLEVKGPPPTPFNEEECRCLARETSDQVFLTYGEFGLDTLLICFFPNGEKEVTTLVGFLTQRSSFEAAAAAIWWASRKRFSRHKASKVVQLELAGSR